jgi:hypothetical protein
MLTSAHASVELMVVRQRVSIWSASRQHLIRDLGLLFRADVVLTLRDEDGHMEFFDEGLVHGDAAEAGEPVEGGGGVEGP